MKGIRGLFIFCIIILLFTIPSFANQLNNITFNNQPIPLWINQSNYSNYLPVYLDNSSQLVNYQAISINDIYSFYYLSGNNYYYICCSNIQLSGTSYRVWNNGYSDGTFTLSYYNENSGLYYYQDNGFIRRNSNDINTLYVPVYDSLQDGLNAIQTYLNNPSQETVWNQSTQVEIPKGTVAYIGVPSNGTLTMSGTKMMPVDSRIIGSQLWDDPTRVKKVNSRPTSGESLAGIEQGSMPNWKKSDSLQSPIGQTNIGVFGPSDWVFNGEERFLRIYNPYYYGTAGTFNLGGGTFIENNSLFVTISGYSSIRLYPIRDTVDDYGFVGTIPSSDDFWDTVITGDPESNNPPTISYIPSNPSMNNTPDDMMLNRPSGSININQYIQQITETLSDFASNFVNLLQAPISHVRQLISAGSEYFGVIRGLYSWMPIQVQGLLESAMVVSISIGVISLLL